MDLRFITFYFITMFFFCLGQEEVKSGPFDYTLTKIKECNDTGTNEIQFNLNTERRQRYGERTKYCFSGNITFKRDMDDNIQNHITVTVNENGSYSENFMQIHLKHACSDLKKLEANGFKMMQAKGINIMDCPVKKGTYYVNCTHLPNVHPKSMQEFPYGMYRTVMEFKDRHTRLGCVKIDTNVHP